MVGSYFSQAEYQPRWLADLRAITWRESRGGPAQVSVFRGATVLCGRTRFRGIPARLDPAVLFDDQEIGRFPREGGRPPSFGPPLVRGHVLGGLPAVVEPTVPRQLDRKIRR